MHHVVCIRFCYDDLIGKVSYTRYRALGPELIPTFDDDLHAHNTTAAAAPDSRSVDSPGGVTEGED